MRPRITYANVVSTLCLFLLLAGGTAYALDGSNTVFSDDIVHGEVKLADVGQGAVASPELKNDSIIAPDVAPSSLTGAKVVDNSLKGVDIDESTLSSIGGGGPAGGDLTGSYPNPEIAPDAVGADEIATEAVTASEIRVAAVGGSEIAGLIRTQNSTSVPSGGVGSVSAECEPGTRIVSGGAHFAFPSGDISASRRGVNDWIAAGQNNGNVAQDLTADAYCLQRGFE